MGLLLALNILVRSKTRSSTNYYGEEIETVIFLNKITQAIKNEVKKSPMTI